METDQEMPIDPIIKHASSTIELKKANPSVPEWRSKASQEREKRQRSNPNCSLIKTTIFNLEAVKSEKRGER